jgi:hypothetical protein
MREPLHGHRERSTEFRWRNGATNNSCPLRHGHAIRFLELDQIDRICTALEATETADDGRKKAGPWSRPADAAPFAGCDPHASDCVRRLRDRGADQDAQRQDRPFLLGLAGRLAEFTYVATWHGTPTRPFVFGPDTQQSSAGASITNRPLSKSRASGDAACAAMSRTNCSQLVRHHKTAVVSC